MAIGHLISNIGHDINNVGKAVAKGASWVQGEVSKGVEHVDEAVDHGVDTFEHSALGKTAVGHFLGEAVKDGTHFTGGLVKGVSGFATGAVGLAGGAVRLAGVGVQYSSDGTYRKEINHDVSNFAHQVAANPGAIPSAIGHSISNAWHHDKADFLGQVVGQVGTALAGGEIVAAAKAAGTVGEGAAAVSEGAAAVTEGTAAVSESAAVASEGAATVSEGAAAAGETAAPLAEAGANGNSGWLGQTVSNLNGKVGELRGQLPDQLGALREKLNGQFDSLRGRLGQVGSQVRENAPGQLSEWRGQLSGLKDKFSGGEGNWRETLGFKTPAADEGDAMVKMGVKLNTTQREALTNLRSRFFGSPAEAEAVTSEAAPAAELAPEAEIAEGSQEPAAGSRWQQMLGFKTPAADEGDAMVKMGMKLNTTQREALSNLRSRFLGAPAETEAVTAEAAPAAELAPETEIAPEVAEAAQEPTAGSRWQQMLGLQTPAADEGDQMVSWGMKLNSTQREAWDGFKSRWSGGA